MENISFNHIRKFIHDHKDSCLWYMDCNYSDNDTERILYILESIKAKCNLADYRHIGGLKEWLLRQDRKS